MDSNELSHVQNIYCSHSICEMLQIKSEAAKKKNQYVVSEG